MLGSRKLLVAEFAAALLILAAIAWASNEFIVQQLQYAEAASHHQELLGTISTLLRQVSVVESASQSFALTGDKDFLSVYERARARIPQTWAAAEKLLQDDPEDAVARRDIPLLLREKLEIHAQLVESAQRRGAGNVKELVESRRGLEAMKKLREVTDMLSKEETAELQTGRVAAARRAGQVRQILLGGTAVSFIILIMVFGLLERESTLRHRAQHEHARSALLLRRVLDTLPVGVWVTDSTGNIFLANRAGQELWGGARFVGVDHYGDYKAWWAGTGKRIEAEESPLARAIKNRETSINELVEIETFDGHRKIILNSAAPVIGSRDALIGAIGVNQDITERKKLEDERERLIAELQETLKNVKTLEGLLPICAHCKKIRDDKGYWTQVEVYVRDHAAVEFSHGICPDCARRFFPAYYPAVPGDSSKGS